MPPPRPYQSQSAQARALACTLHVFDRMARLRIDEIEEAVQAYIDEVGIRSYQAAFHETVKRKLSSLRGESPGRDWGQRRRKE